MTVQDSAAFLSEFAIAEEGTKGTAETSPAVYDYFTDDPNINPVQNVITFGHVQKREQINKVLGNYHIEGNIPQIAAPEGMFPYWLKLALGSVSSSQIDTSTAYSHEFTPADEIPSFTTWLNRGGAQEVKIPYCMVQSLELQQSINDALRATIGFVGQKDTASDDFGTPEYSELDPFMNQDLTVSIGGSEAPEVHNTTLAIQNSINVDMGRAHGTRTYNGLVATERAISGSLNLYFDDDTEYERFWGDVSTPATEPQNNKLTTDLSLVWDTGIEIDSGNNYKLTIDIPTVVYEGTTINTGGDRVVQTVNFGALYNSSSEYDIKATLQNEITGYTV